MEKRPWGRQDAAALYEAVDFGFLKKGKEKLKSQTVYNNQQSFDFVI
jgi:hypothetical protein